MPAAANVSAIATTNGAPAGVSSKAFGDPIRVESPAARITPESMGHRTPSCGYQRTSGMLDFVPRTPYTGPAFRPVRASSFLFWDRPLRVTAERRVELLTIDAHRRTGLCPPGLSHGSSSTRDSGSSAMKAASSTSFIAVLYEGLCSSCSEKASVWNFNLRNRPRDRDRKSVV